MRFALIGPSAPLRGGIAQYHDRLAAALAARGNRVQRLSFRRQYPRLLFPGTSQVTPSAEGRASSPTVTAAGSSGRATDLEPVRRPSLAGHGEDNTLIPADPVLDSLNPASWRRTADAAASADVAVCEWWHPFFGPALGTVARRLARRRPRVPAIFICHNLTPHEAMPGGSWLRRFAFAQAAGFIAQSAGDVADLEARYPTRPIRLLLPPATAPAPCPHAGDRTACAAALGLPPARRRALFFGYVRAYKGLPTLIEALARTPADVQLVVAGEIYHRDAAFYRALGKRHGIASRVVLLDRFLPEREVACCFAAADVVVLPYWQASQSAVVPLAMACGRPVVATAVGGLPDLVRSGETGLLVPARDAVALAAAIERALVNAEPWGRAAAAAARALTWERAAATVEDLARGVHDRTGTGG